MQTNTREPKTENANGGADCIGSSTVTESCNLGECPGNNRPTTLIFSVLLSIILL